MTKIYANVLLSDDEILFYWVGQSRCTVDDFYKDFMYSGINKSEYEKTHKLKVETMAFEFENERLNNYCFSEIARSFFKFWDISPDSKGEPAYEASRRVQI